MSFNTSVSKGHVTLKRLVVERKGVKFGTLWHTQYIRSGTFDIVLCLLFSVFYFKIDMMEHLCNVSIVITTAAFKQEFKFHMNLYFSKAFILTFLRDICTNNSSQVFNLKTPRNTHRTETYGTSVYPYLDLDLNNIVPALHLTAERQKLMTCPK